MACRIWWVFVEGGGIVAKLRADKPEHFFVSFFSKEAASRLSKQLLTSIDTFSYATFFFQAGDTGCLSKQ